MALVVGGSLKHCQVHALHGDNNLVAYIWLGQGGLAHGSPITEIVVCIKAEINNDAKSDDVESDV